MISLQGFPPGVADRLGYYVYSLTDPEEDRPFYVGKGIGDRIFAHMHQALVSPLETDKLDTIRSVLSRGLEVNCRILRHGLTEKEAFEVEAALIDYIGLRELTNAVSGHYANVRGGMSIPEVIALYQAPEVEIVEPAILILVSRLFERGIDDDRLYQITRGDWVLGERRSKAKFAFSVYNGIVRQVYEIGEWIPVDPSQPTQKAKRRWRFDGVVSTALEHYIGTNVTRYIKPGAQNPIRYVNC